MRQERGSNDLNPNFLICEMGDSLQISGSEMFICSRWPAACMNYLKWGGGAGTIIIDFQGHPWKFWFGGSGVDPVVCILNKQFSVLKI